MDQDPELEAIRARLRQELTEGAGSNAAPAANTGGAPVLDHPVETDDASLPDLVREHSLLVVDVWAPWCGPCRILGPTIDQLAAEMAGSVTFAKLNADHNPGTMSAFGIQGIPTLLIFKDGRLVDRVVGVPATPALRHQILRHKGPGGRGGRASPGPRRL